MAELPSIANNIAQVTAPRAPVSPGQIEGPHQELAANMDKAGEILMKDVAAPLAERAGAVSVRAGPDGMPIVDRGPLPIVGDAGIAFGRAARNTELAMLQPKIENKLAEMRQQFPNDPAGFKTASDDYTEQLVRSIPDPLLKGPVLKIASDHAGQEYRSSLVQTNNTNRENALISSQARLTDLNERGSSIARQNGVTTPQYAAIHADRVAILKELTADPRFNFPPARADQILRESRDQDVEQAVIGDVLRTYKTKQNAGEAQRALQDAFWGPGSEKLSLSAQKRDHGVTEGLRALQRMSSEERADTAAFRQTVTKYTENLLKAPGSFDEIAHSALVAKSNDVGDFRTRAELDAARTMIPLWQAIRGLTPTQANAVTTEMARGIVPALPARLPVPEHDAMIDTEAKRRGISPELAKRVAMIESGGNPAAVTGSYKGMFQLSAAEFAKYGGGGDIFNPADNARAGIASLAEKAQNFRAKYGRDPSATELYLAHQQGEGGLAAHLGAPNAPAWQNMASTAEGQQRGAEWAKKAVWGNVPDTMKPLFPGGVDTVTSQQFMDVWSQKVQGIPFGTGGLVSGQSVFASRNPYVPKLFESTVAQMRVEQGKNAEHLSAAIIKQAEGRDTIPPDTISTFVAAAVASGKEDLLLKVQPALQAFDTWQQTQGGGPSVAAALEAQIKTAKAGGVDPVRYAMLSNLDKMVKDGAEELKKEPLTEGARRGWVAPINPIDTSSGQSFSAGLDERQAKIAVMRQTDPTLGPTKAFGDNEGEAVKTALTQGDPKVAGQLLDAMRASLSPDNYRATMASKPIKEALGGMITSYDPVRLNAAMSTLDALQKSDPVGFATTWKDEEKRLHVWQSWKDSATPQEVAERFKRADDPAFAKARQELESLADTENKKMKPVDVAGAVYALDHPVLSHVPFMGPSAPSDGMQAQAMKSEFDGVRRELRGMGVDPDQATKQAAKKLTTIYGTSDINGGDMMRHPPERYYPAIGGSHDWMRGPIEADIEKAVGKPRLGFTRTDLGPRTSTNWTYNLVADSQTEAEIGSNRPPSYQVFVKDADTGMVNAPRDSDGNLMRYRWDPTQPQAMNREEFDRRHAGSQSLRTEQAKQGDFLRNVREAAGR